MRKLFKLFAGAFLGGIGLSSHAAACPKADFADGTPLQFLVPAAGAMSKSFGMHFHELLNIKTFHNGLDFDGASGLPIVAAASGKVVRAGHAGYFGNVVRIEHGRGVETVYGHLSWYQVSEGDCVHAGQGIAVMGCTGLCGHPHVHFEVLRGGQYVDPEPLLQISKP